MIIEHDSDIIDRLEHSIHNGIDVDFLIFRDGKVLLLSPTDLAMYKHNDAITDPLGNGLISQATLPDGISIMPFEKKLVKEYKAGYVGMFDGKALLITPIAIQLFNNKTDALHNRNQIVRLDLGT